MSEKVTYRYLLPRKILLLLLSQILCTSGISQVIKGLVLDSNTSTKINFASVYFNGTFIGTHTDEKGYFELDISAFRTMPLTISALGYYSINLSDLKPDKQYIIYLQPKVYELQEVVVTARGNWYEQKTGYYIFKKEFLGYSVNAGLCVIRNNDDIIINYKNKSDTLCAFSIKDSLYIAYQSKLPQTRIRMLKDTIGFDQSGFFDPLGIAWQGEMSKQRTGDLLPFEYRSK